MAKAKKLPSGNWRTRVFDYVDSDGKKHYKSFTAASRKESEYLAAQYSTNKYLFSTDNDNMSVNEIIDTYIKAKKSTLSPTTISCYTTDFKNHFKEIGNLKIKALNSSIIQRWIGCLSQSLAPKTVRNTYGLFVSALKFYDVWRNYKIKLPEKIIEIDYIPTDDDIKTVMNYYQQHNQDMLIAVCLSAFGTLRRSEICALTADDVVGNKIIINKSMILNRENKEWIIRPTPKTLSSNRIVEYPKFIIDMLPKKDKLVKLLPSSITSSHIQTIKRLHLHHFRFHDYRHYAASIMHAIGIPDVYIMSRGGWSSDDTLKKIYRNSLEDYNIAYTDKINNYTKNMTQNMTREITNND